VKKRTSGVGLNQRSFIEHKFKYETLNTPAKDFVSGFFEHWLGKSTYRSCLLITVDQISREPKCTSLFFGHAIFVSRRVNKNILLVQNQRKIFAPNQTLPSIFCKT